MSGELKVVHLIEQEETTDPLPSPEAESVFGEGDDAETICTEATTKSVVCEEDALMHDINEALDQFERSTEASRAIATALVSKETALVNNRLLSIQKKLRRREDCTAALCERPSKRMRGDIKQEQESLWNRALRTRRMNMLLQSLESTQQLLLDELMACADDADLSEWR